jgi:hypothetical protein
MAKVTTPHAVIKTINFLEIVLGFHPGAPSTVEALPPITAESETDLRMDFHYPVGSARNELKSLHVRSWGPKGNMSLHIRGMIKPTKHPLCIEELARDSGATAERTQDGQCIEITLHRPHIVQLVQLRSPDLVMAFVGSRAWD